VSYPNPWDSPDFFERVTIGGRPVLATLIAIDGVEIEDEWAAQRPTGNSGATNVFKGTKPPGDVTLTFEAVTVEDWDDLRAHWDNLAPVPGSGTNGTGATTGSPGSAAYGQSFTQGKSPTTSTNTAKPEDLLKQVQAALAAVQSGANVTGAPAATSTTTTKSSAASTPNPGPKPPTRSIVNGYLNYVGMVAISRKKWKGPYPSPTRGMRVDLTVVNQKEPVKAAVGAASPKAKDDPAAKQIAFGEIQDPASNAKAFNQGAAQQGALP
jgi:hypothetical protein